MRCTLVIIICHLTNSVSADLSLNSGSGSDNDDTSISFSLPMESLPATSIMPLATSSVISQTVSTLPTQPPTAVSNAAYIVNIVIGVLFGMFSIGLLVIVLLYVM